jgi:hypothetical protein
VEITNYNTSSKRSLNLAHFDEISKSGDEDIYDVFCNLMEEEML